jgi:hypothetical protein
MTATNKRYSYPRVTVIRINVHPTGEKPTNTPHASHTQSTYGPRLYTSHMVNAYQPFTESSTNFYRSTAPEKKGSQHNPQLDGGLIRGSILSFSPTTANEAMGKRQASIDNQLIGLLGLYHQHAIGTFNTCSRGPTHRSLIDTGGGYDLEGAIFSHTSPRPSQLMVSPFHLRAPPGLQFNQ